MQIIFPKDLGTIFKLKYRRWLCMDFYFQVSVWVTVNCLTFLLSHMSAYLSILTWFVSRVGSLRPPHTGHCDTTTGTSPSDRILRALLCDVAVKDTWDIPLRDHVVFLLFWLLNVYVDNSAIGRHLSWFRCYSTCDSKIPGGPLFLPNYQAKEKSKKREKMKNWATQIKVGFTRWKVALELIAHRATSPLNFPTVSSKVWTNLYDVP